MNVMVQYIIQISDEVLLNICIYIDKNYNY